MSRLKVEKFYFRKMKKDIKTYSNQTFAQNFKYFMFAKKLTLKDISEKTSLPLSTISTWRRGRVPRDPEALKKLLKLFKTSKREMLGTEISHPVIFANERPTNDDASTIVAQINRHIKILSTQASADKNLKKILSSLKKDYPLKKR